MIQLLGEFCKFNVFQTVAPHKVQRWLSRDWIARCDGRFPKNPEIGRFVLNAPVCLGEAQGIASVTEQFQNSKRASSR